MKIKILLLVVFYQWMSYSFGQNIIGFVKSEDGEPIEYAHVAVLNTSKGAIADSTGYFNITLSNGVYQLSVNCLGYSNTIKEVVVADDKTTTVTVVLKENLEALDEIVVTASKDEENIVMSNMSISSLSAEKIQDTRTWNLSNLTGIIPNYQYADVGVGYQQQISLRGVSVFSNNPAVATYVDGVNALDISANGLQFADIERIEVLRGPQGTLYGRNAMGGVINIITKKPSNKRSGFFEASAGNQGLQRYAFGVRTPVIKDKLFVGLSGQFQRQYGFYTTDTTESFTFFGTTYTGPTQRGVRVGDADSYYGNLFVKWLPTKNVDITFNLKAQEDRSIGPSSYFQAAVSDSFALKNPYKFTINRFGSDKRQILNSSVALKYYHSKFTLTSITAYQYILQYYDNIDADYWSFDVAYSASFHNKTGDAMPQGVISQELRFSSPANNRKFKWTAGTYIFSQKYDYRTATVYAQPLAALFGYSGTDVNQNDQNNSGIAFFGQGTYHLTRRLDITGGLRFDYENRKSTIASFNIDGNDNRTYSRIDTTRQKSFTALSPKAVISYHIRENQNIYVSYTRGFRAGGINATTKFQGYETYNPEHSDNYELGYKYASNNKKIFFTSTLFYINWKDLQLDYRPDGVTYITANIGDVHSKGVEVEVAVKPVRNLQIDYSLGLNDATYYNFEYLGKDISGNRTIMAPRSTMFLAAQYTIPVSKNIKTIIRGEWRRIGEQYFDLENKIRQPNYNLFNTRIGFSYKQANLAFWVQNIFDKTYLTYAFPAVFRYSLLNRPRSFGVTLTFNF